MLAVRCPIIVSRKSKEHFFPKWEGPCMVDTFDSNGAYRRQRNKKWHITTPSDNLLKSSMARTVTENPPTRKRLNCFRIHS